MSPLGEALTCISKNLPSCKLQNDMPPKPPVPLLSLQLPTWKKNTWQPFREFVNSIYRLNKAQPELITRENLLQSYRLKISQTSILDHATKERECIRAMDRDNNDFVNSYIERAKGLTAFKISQSIFGRTTAIGQRGARRASNVSLQSPRFNAKVDKVVNWSKYVNRLRKANPGVNITPRLADQLLDVPENITGMSRTYLQNHKRQKPGEIEAEVVLKKPEALKDKSDERDEYWRSQGVNPNDDG